MDSSTSVIKMLAGNKIFIPSYQRAFSWETPFENNNLNTQTDVFLSDLTDYGRSNAKTHYYFGHFLFEEISDRNFGVIDGQQRLTTIIIFLAVLFNKLKTLRALTEQEEMLYEDMIRRKSTCVFSTVDYDNQLFIDYVIDQSKKDKNVETESAKRIIKAFDYFTVALAEKDDLFLSKMLKIITEASCTTHKVKNESEAVQMFIFQNNRGKKPSNLEIIKAQFMFNVHLYAGEEREGLIGEIKSRFEKIYKSISSIEYSIDEDEVLIHTLRVHFNSLWESNPIEKINKQLSENDPIPFIKSFTRSLAVSFDHMTTFFAKDEREYPEIHSIKTLGGFGIAIPFIIKAYTFGLAKNEIIRICSAMESLVLRNRLIGTRAELTSRINDVYQNFTPDQPDINPILDKIEGIKNAPSDSWWWAYWNNAELEKALQGKIHHSTAKFLLWKYENFLETQGKSGYSLTRFDKILSPELEHIAPETPTDGTPVSAGYCEYDEEFKNQFIDCLGNYLLLSKSHNCSVGNRPFREKRATYLYLAQQREIQSVTAETEIWDKKQISQRKDKIIKYILENL